jgi:hypothetical protein
MPSVEFEPTITSFERAKTVHALDCGATVILEGESELLNTPPPNSPIISQNSEYAFIQYKAHTKGKKGKVVSVLNCE